MRKFGSVLPSSLLGFGLLLSLDRASVNVDARAEEVQIAAVGGPAGRVVRSVLDKSELLGLSAYRRHSPEIGDQAVLGEIAARNREHRPQPVGRSEEHTSELQS